MRHFIAPRTVSLPFPSQLPSSVRPLLPSRLLSCTAPTCAQQSNFSLRGCTLLPMITWCPTGLEPETLLRYIKAHFRAARCDDNILEVLSGVSLSLSPPSGSVCGLSKARETHRRNRMVLAYVVSRFFFFLHPRTDSTVAVTPSVSSHNDAASQVSPREAFLFTRLAGISL